jgi:RNA polymerase sigma factor (sigma-70 family)
VPTKTFAKGSAVDDLGSLVSQAKNGDLAAFGELVERFQHMAYGYACALLGDFHLAQDAAQEAFLEAYRSLPKLHEPRAFPAWLRRIVFKRCDRLTRGKRLPTLPLAAAADKAADGPEPAKEVEAQEMREAVLAALRSLPENQRTVTVLYYIDGYSQQEVAGFLQVPVSTVNNRLHAARRKLKERMVAMVEKTLEANAPDPKEAREVAAFLLDFSQRIGEGVRVLDALGELESRIVNPGLRECVRQLLQALKEGRTISEGLSEHGRLFPPMVLALIKDGERFGMLDQATPLAAQWLREGGFDADPHLFAGGLGSSLRDYVKSGIDAGAVEVVIDSTQRGTHPKDPSCQVVWIEHVMADGTRRKADFMHPGHFGEVSLHLRNQTLLDERQQGDCIKGRLLLTLGAGRGKEMVFPVSYRPMRGGEEIRINIARSA